MAFLDDVKRESVLVQHIEDPTYTGLQFYKFLTEVHGVTTDEQRFPFKTTWHPEDIRAVTPSLLEVVRKKAEVPKSEYDKLTPKAKQAVSMLQKETTQKAEAFTAAAMQLNVAAEAVVALEAVGIPDEDEENPHDPGSYEGRLIHAFDASVENFEQAKRNLALAALHIMKLASAMRKLVLASHDADREDVDGPLGDTDLACLARVRKEKREETMASATVSALKKSANRNHTRDGGDGDGQGRGKDKWKKKKKKNRQRGREEGSSTGGGGGGTTDNAAGDG
mmetsp:Transcript_4131/g.11540  ORF Transcript_4131/g.11540 Transcript_4131/m.11540 type:complete len:280 (-) Transcript_4131:2382-3221(-)